MRDIGLAAATLLVIIPIYRFLGGFSNRVAILSGLVLGTVVAIPFGAADFGRLGDAAPFQLTEPFHLGTPTFAIGAIISMLVVMLVVMTETTADILAIGEVVDKRLTAATSLEPPAGPDRHGAGVVHEGGDGPRETRCVSRPCGG